MGAIEFLGCDANRLVGSQFSEPESALTQWCVTWPILSLQAGSLWGEFEVRNPEWLLAHIGSCQVAELIPFHSEGSVRGHGCAERSAWAVLGDVGIFSSFLADSGKMRKNSCMRVKTSG